MTLPPLYRQLRNHVGTIANALDVVEQCDQRQEWGLDADAKRERALRTIEARIVALCETAGVRSRFHESLTDQIYALQQENQQLRERLKHADAALVRYAQGVAA